MEEDFVTTMSRRAVNATSEDEAATLARAAAHLAEAALMQEQAETQRRHREGDQA